jgi:hypothetical protein
MYSVFSAHPELVNKYRVVDVRGDGNCCSRAVAALLFDDEQEYGMVKSMTLRWLDDHPEHVINEIASLGDIIVY